MNSLIVLGNNYLFKEEVWEKLKQIPPGSVTTYVALARALGRPGAARAVGNALHKNPNAPFVPCHRVVCADGLIGGYAFGVERKAELLHKEGVCCEKGKIVDFKNRLFYFDK